MSIEKCSHIIDVYINIWDDFDENINKVYRHKTYTTYAYIESSSQSLSNDEKLFILQFLKERLVNNQVFADKDLFVHYFIAGENLNFITLLSKFIHTIRNKTKSPFHYERYELCFKNLTHENLDNHVLPFLQSSELDLINCKNGNHYKLNIYSES